LEEHLQRRCSRASNVGPASQLRWLSFIDNAAVRGYLIIA
jgi:hypothetical protein